MPIREIILERIPARDSVMVINKSGISWSAAFVKKNQLEKMEGVSFLTNDEDPYFLGFHFYASANRVNTLSLMQSGRSKGASAGFTVKAGELISHSKILQKIVKSPNKQQRTFEILKEKHEDFYKIFLRPMFEISVKWSSRGKIDQSVIGIYRYRDLENQIIYIGKGAVKSRAATPGREEWGIDLIEFSIMDSDESCLKWESFYLQNHRDEVGILPAFNRISGHGQFE